MEFRKVGPVITSEIVRETLFADDLLTRLAEIQNGHISHIQAKGIMLTTKLCKKDLLVFWQLLLELQYLFTIKKEPREKDRFDD